MLVLPWTLISQRRADCGDEAFKGQMAAPGRQLVRKLWALTRKPNSSIYIRQTSAAPANISPREPVGTRGTDIHGHDSPCDRPRSMCSLARGLRGPELVPLLPEDTPGAQSTQGLMSRGRRELTWIL